MTKLVPCPVCGKEPIYVRPDFAARRVSCGSSFGTHNLRVFGKTKREAIAAWNKAFRRPR